VGSIQSTLSGPSQSDGLHRRPASNETSDRVVEWLRANDVQLGLHSTNYTTANMDSTPGLEVYESYETDYKTLAASIGDKLKGEARETKGGELKGKSTNTTHRRI
jgi:hypothetical protein